MTKETIDAIYRRIGENMARAQEEAAQLTRADRRDEAALAKIRGNVNGIARSLMDTLLKGDPSGHAARAKFKAVTDQWRAHRAQAQEHGDGVQAALEDVKLTEADALLALMREE